MSFPPDLELSDSWVEGRPDLRWHSTVTTAEVEVAGTRSAAEAGGVVLIPEDVPHQVANAGDEVLRFVEWQTIG